jgi:hypothetical protein
MLKKTTTMKLKKVSKSLKQKLKKRAKQNADFFQ